MEMTKGIVLAEKFFPHVRFIVSREDMGDFLVKIYGKEFVIRLFPHQLNFRHPFSFIKQYLQYLIQRKKVLKEIQKVSPTEAYFFFVGFHPVESWILKKLCTQVSLYHILPVEGYKLVKRYPLYDLIKLKTLSFLYDLPVILRTSNHHFLTGVADSYYYEILKAKQVFAPPQGSKGPNFDVILEKLGLSQLTLDVLFLVDDDGKTEEKSYLGPVRTIATWLIEQGFKVGIKDHPHFGLKKAFIVDGAIEIHRFIPAGLILSKASIIITGTSASLFEANEHQTLPISLIKFLKMPPSWKAHFYEYLKQNDKDSKIQYPKTIEEIKNLCIKRLNHNGQ